MATAADNKLHASTYRKIAYKNVIQFITGQTDTFPREILEYTSDAEYNLLLEIIERICLNNCYVKAVERFIYHSRYKQKYSIFNLVISARAAYHKCKCKSDAILGKYDFFTYDIKYYRPRRRKISMLAKGNQRSGIYKLFELGCYMLYTIYRRLNIGFSARELNYMCSQIDLDVLLEELAQNLTKYPALFTTAEYKTIANALNHVVNAELNKLNTNELRAIKKYIDVFNQLANLKAAPKKSVKRKRSK